jgi:hypothetical protein
MAMRLLGLLLLLLLTLASAADSAATAAPIAELTIVKDQAVLFTYQPKGPLSDALVLDEKTLPEFFRVVKSPVRGDVDFVFQRCGWYNVSSSRAYDPDGKNLTTKYRSVWSMRWQCQDFKEGNFILNRGDIVRLIPSSVKYDEKTGDYLVWEDLYVDGELVPGATWWGGQALTLYNDIVPSPGSFGGPGTNNTQSFNTTDTFRLAIVGMKCAQGIGYDSGTSRVWLKWPNGTMIAQSDDVAWSGSDWINFTFPAPVVIGVNSTYGAYLAMQEWVIGACASTCDVPGSYGGGEAGDLATKDYSLRVWGLPPADTTPPIVIYQEPDDGADFCAGQGINFTSYLEDAESPLANMSLWTEETAWGIAASNSTELVNGTNNTILYSFAVAGTYTWAMDACDTAGNCAFGHGNEDISANRTIYIEDCQTTTTTTTTICGNGTCCPTNITAWPSTPMKIEIGGFQWLTLFFIIAVTAAILGGFFMRG